MSHEQRLEQLGLPLPPAPKSLGVYRPIVVVGDIAYLSGHVPLQQDGTLVTGRIGQDLDQRAGYEAAQLAGLAMLATLKSTLHTLERVERVIKIFGVVNCVPHFEQQPAVINGCSDLLVDVFGPDRGVGARSVIGAASLPGNAPVEIEAMFLLQP